MKLLKSLTRIFTASVIGSVFMFMLTFIVMQTWDVLVMVFADPRVGLAAIFMICVTAGAFFGFGKLTKWAFNK